jgi:cytochrome c553
VTWTEETLTIVSSGGAFRGLLLAQRCNHCHGDEGFSSVPVFPNLAGEDRLSFWKQMQDFRSGKRTSPVMQGIADGFSARASADLAAYYAMLPTASDPQDTRALPQAMQDSLSCLDGHPPHYFRRRPAWHTTLPVVPRSGELCERGATTLFPER